MLSTPPFVGKNLHVTPFYDSFTTNREDEACLKSSFKFDAKYQMDLLFDDFGGSIPESIWEDENIDDSKILGLGMEIGEVVVAVKTIAVKSFDGYRMDISKYHHVGHQAR